MNLGVDDPLPRAPAALEDIGRWRLAEDVGPGLHTNDNYQSVKP